MPQCIKDYLATKGFDKSLLDAITYSDNGLPTVAEIAPIAGGVLSPIIGALPGDTVIQGGAITVDDHIYFRDTGQFNAADGLTPGEIAFVAHEATHSLQMRTITGYKAKYVGYFLVNLLLKNTFNPAGQAIENSYREIPYEGDARAKQADIDNDIATNGNPCDPKPVQPSNPAQRAKPRGRKKRRGR